MHDEVRTAFADVMERGLAPRVDLDYLATACIAIVREVGERMLRARAARRARPPPSSASR